LSRLWTDWDQLEGVDVDCLKSFSPLPETLIHKLDERLQPWNLEQIRQFPPDAPIRVDSYGIVSPPTPDNLGNLREMKFLMFDFAPNCEPVIQRFIHRDFGTYDQWFEPRTNTVRRIMWLENLMPKLNIEHIPLSDRASLAEALTLLAGTRPGASHRPPIQFLAPCQLPSLHLGEVWPQSDRVYQVLVGDNAETLAEFWNGAFWKMIWPVPYAHQLWLPLDLANDPLLREALGNWFHCHPTGI